MTDPFLSPRRPPFQEQQTAPWTPPPPPAPSSASFGPGSSRDYFAPPRPYGDQPWRPQTGVEYGLNVGAVEQAYSTMYGRQRGRGIAIAAFVLGTIAIVICAAPVLSYPAVVLAGLSIGLGIAAVRRTARRGLAIAGLVLAPIALVGAIIASILWTGVFVDAVRVAQQCEDQHPNLGPAFQRCVDQGGPDAPASPSTAGNGEPARFAQPAHFVD